MKDFNKLTDIEIYNLSEDEIKTYKRLLLAENGVKFPEKPQPTKELEIAPDIIVYTIDGLSDKWSNVCFKTIEAAREFVAFILKFKDIGSIKSSNVDYKILTFDEGLPKDWQGNMPTLNIQANPVFAKDTYNALEKSIREYKSQKEKYSEKRKAYDAAVNKACEITEEISEKIQNVRKDIDYKESLCFKLENDYLPLAENNFDIAFNFLDKAYHLSDSDKDYIREKFNRVGE